MPVISTNIAANSAVRYLNINSKDQTSSLSKLASGSRIVQAKDDAAGLAISTRISSDITALNQAAVNSSHGISVLQTADGGASNISDILQRMKALASQSASGTVTNNERAYIQAEFEELVNEVDGISDSTRYNGISLLNGTSDFADDGISVMVGSDATDVVQVNIDTLNTENLRISYSDGVLAEGGAQTSATATGTTNLFTAGAPSAENLSITIDDEVFNVAIDSADTAQIVVDKINDALGYSGTASIGAGGTLSITAASEGTGSSIEVNTDLTAGNGVMGAFGDYPVAATGSAAASAPADIVLTIPGNDLDTGTGASFKVNGTLVELTGDNLTGTDVAAAINAALGADSTISASAAAGVVTIANTETGEDAYTQLDSLSGVTAAALGAVINREAGSISVGTQDDAINAIASIDRAIDVVSKARANIGALESRFSFRSASIATSLENLEASNSAIADVDVASEAAKLASARVKTQAAVASAAQASQMPQDLLRLLQ